MKIMFFAHDPGGANAIAPLLQSVDPRHELIVKAKGPALSILENAQEFNNDLTNIMPDLIITGTSANDFTEKELWKEASKLNIKTMAILDHWCNYGIRFSKYGLKDIDKFDQSCDFLPDYIIVMDEYAKQEMVKEGVPSNIIYPLGNPHFKSLKDSFEKLNVDNLRKTLLEDKEKLVVWASEPYIEDYGQGMELECLKDIIKIIPNNAQLIIKPHPKESENKFKEFTNLKIIKNVSSQQIIKAADLVLSMTSMFLIESIIAGKPTLSYQKNQTDKNKFILTKIGALPFISDIINLRKEVYKILTNEYIKSNFKLAFEATDNIKKFIEERVCQN